MEYLQGIRGLTEYKDWLTSRTQGRLQGPSGADSQPMTGFYYYHITLKSKYLFPK